MQTQHRSKKAKPGKFPFQKVFGGIALVVIVAAAYGIWQSFGTQSNPPPEGTPSNVASNFSLKDINGTQVSLNAYQGKPILVHFMALAGCTGQLNPISMEKLPQLRSVSTQYGDKVAVVTVSVATCASCDTILAGIREQYGISWILGNDYDDEKLDIVNAYSGFAPIVPFMTGPSSS